MRAGLLCLLFLFACADPGPRDRSLLLRTPETRPARSKKDRPAKPAPSVIGLVPDALAIYYPENAELVLRFRSLNVLVRDVGPHLRRAARAYPRLGLPSARPLELVRRACSLSPDTEIDPGRPFALAKTADGWVGILPARARPGEARIRQLDALYSVAGAPEALQECRPSFRKGFYLPGDVSVIASPEAVPALGAHVAELGKAVGIDFTFLRGWLPALPKDVRRVDLSVRLREDELRIDVRAAPDPDSPAGLHLARLKTRDSGAVRWLPPGGTAYLDLVCAPAEIDSLMEDLVDPVGRRGWGEKTPVAWRRFLETLGAEAAAMLDLEEDGSGRVLLAALADNPEETAAFFESYDFTGLLNAIAGPEGRLEWRPDAFTYEDVAVGAVTGYVDRTRLHAWQATDDVALVTLSRLLRGPAVVYVAIVGDKLGIVVGQRAREDMELLIRVLKDGKPTANEHSRGMHEIFPLRLGGLSVDVTELLRGTRGAARYWPGNGRKLRDLVLEKRLRASLAVTAEGGALRFALRIPPVELAETAAAVRAELDER